MEHIAYEEEERKFFDIEQAREGVGIQFSLSESVVEEELIEGSEPIKNFIDTISVLKYMKLYFEEIEILNEEYKSIDDAYVSTSFKLDVFNIINRDLNLERNFSDVSNLNLIDIIYELLYSEVDIDQAISKYSEYSSHNCIDNPFECFSMDYQVSWFSPENKSYEINFCGTLDPENGGHDLLDFNLIVDNVKQRTYTIEIDYGDYNGPSEGNIEDNIVYELVEDIKPSVISTHMKFEQIYRVVGKLTELLNKYSV